MEIQFGESCRGNGRTYTRISVVGAIDGLQFNAYAQTDNGKDVPVFVCPSKAKGDFVLVAPLMAVGITVVVEALNREGKMVTFSNKRIEPLLAAAESHMNRIFRRQVVHEVRNIDARPLAAHTYVKINEIIRDADNKWFVYGFAELPVLDERTADATLELRVLDDKGLPINEDGSWVVLGDSVSLAMPYGDEQLRTVQFSFRVCDLPRPVIVWAHVPGCEQLDGFTSVETGEMRTMVKIRDEFTRPADRSPEYERWFLERHRADARELAVQAKTHFQYEPTFSIVTPLFHTPVDFLNEMVDSVVAQSYGKWELVLVNASPDDAELEQAVRQRSQQDDRIKVVALPENRGITENTNVGIAAAVGDFLCFLDHDDTIEPNALFEYALALEEHPDIDLFYCDEDKLENGSYLAPYFKPDWNPDLLLGINYVCHFLCVRKSIVDELEPPTSEYDGAQDYHMTFRVSEKARRIHHVPKVLYHWRIHGESTAKDAEQKPYTQEAARLCVESHLERCGIAGRALDSERVPRHYEVEYEVQGEPLVSIVIPSKDGKPVLQRCINSIVEKSTYANYEIIIVENNSTEQETFAYYDELAATLGDRVRVVRYEDDFNFSSIVNFGVDSSKGDYIVLLNNDTEVITPDWIERMLGICQRQDVGAVGVKLLFPDGTVQHAGVFVGGDGPGHINYKLPRFAPGYFDTARLTMDLSAVTAACMMVARSDFDAIDGFDSTFEVDYNDVDFCLRLRQIGLLVVFEPSVELYHYESVTRGGYVSKEKRIRYRHEKALMMERWPEYYELGDPYANPNLVAMPVYFQLDCEGM